ncbi:hypothetical protein AciM339_0771 [Aciduliprofundum sp. MAR08-339]|uniref:NifB/NifX family molybdenum-iron cluster-binding protein n=1 Tax=Aciduliprofundum sp. (strain MAR08-339) TaxID=673860 RepID=UPI0002A48A19|nr:hypothetical protein AciM339_0771 [Aciduliprofundum sp. MAR08-339]
MKVVFPCKGKNGLESQVHGDLFKAKYYLFADVDLEKGELIKWEILEMPLDFLDPGDLPMFIKEHDGELLMAQSIPPQLVEFFNHMRIKVLSGISGKIEDVLKKFLDGKIHEIIEKNVENGY